MKNRYKIFLAESVHESALYHIHGHVILTFDTSAAFLYFPVTKTDLYAAKITIFLQPWVGNEMDNSLTQNVMLAVFILTSCL